ncbi:hypothetical protein JTE90_018746 [Oedothorax gibbosus]|uniref:Major facilitator superfamily (MFS) profile domain-containing protein n=1 Tax=Oedothorax gibbosus TaxID=931172 RepID=A0AAV6UCP9_9ARAC|nr:hypothetical protein JTE90_018746 [Oedothorax gibbosus]
MEYVTPEIPLDSSRLPQKNIKLAILVEDSIAARLDDSMMLADNPPKIRKMYLAAVSALLMAVVMGITTGYSAPATYDMTTRNSSSIKPSKNSVTWIGSVLALGAMCGGLFAGPVADRLGRKTILMLNTLPFMCGWLLICFTKHIAFVIVGRIICGVACGVVSVVVPMYCVEISTSEVRGLLGSSFQGFLVIGTLLCAIIGSYVTWEYLALTGATMTTFALICFCPMPESPRWLISQNDVAGAIKVMNYLQGNNFNAKEECEQIHDDIKSQPKGLLTLNECKHPSIYKPALICAALMFFQQFSGANAVLFYSSAIFGGSKSFLDPKKSTIVLAAVQVVATLLSNAVVDKAGRKLLLILSGALMSISLIALGIYYYISSANIAFQTNFSWIPLSSLVLFLIAFSIGYGSIPWLLAAELVPLRARSTIGGLATFANGLFAFTITKTFSELEEFAYNYGTFWIYSAISLVSCVFVFIMLPETKGKELKEISDYFSQEPKRYHEMSISVISK